MNCACIAIDTDGGPDFIEEGNYTARKEHICYECSRIIEKGEKYRNERGVWEGHFKVYKTCPDCLSMRYAFFCYGFYYGMIWEDLQNYIEESDCQLSGESIKSLTPKARNKVLAIMQEYIDEQDD